MAMRAFEEFCIESWAVNKYEYKTSRAGMENGEVTFAPPSRLNNIFRVRWSEAFKEILYEH